MTSLQSPGILIREQDNTAFAETIDSSVVGVVGLATKGPVNKPTLITSPETLVSKFGNPSEDIPGQGLEGAIEILETTNELYFVRAVNGDATNASASVTMGFCPAVLVSANDYGTVNSLYLTVQVVDNNGVTAFTVPKEYDIIADSTLASQGEAFVEALGDGEITTEPIAAAYITASSDQAYIVASYAGSSCYLYVSAYSDSARTTPVAVLHALDETGEPGAAAAAVTAIGGHIIADDFEYLVQSLYPGAGYNLGISNKTGQVTGCSVEVENVAGPYFQIYVNENGVEAESFRVTLTDSDTFLEDVINISESQGVTSDLIKGQLMDADDDLVPTALTNWADKIDSLIGATVETNYGAGSNPRFVKPIADTYPLDYGSNGAFTVAAATSAIVGSPVDKTGVHALDDDSLNISIAIVPGLTNQSIQNELITLAETSQNFIAVVSPPMGLNEVQDAVDWMNGRYTGRTAAINSSWVAVAWPWVQIFSVYDAKDRWYDPGIFLVRQMAFTDSVAEPWFAPAGFRRGRLTKPSDVEIVVNQGDRDALYKNNVNPIAKFFPEGITLFGQKTAQRFASSLDRINVRRLMIYLRKLLLAVGRPYVFEPNDKFTWELVKDTVEAVLTDIQARRGVTDFQVVCDESVNTPARVARRELWCKIILQPTEAAEYIIFELNLTNQIGKLGT